ncbi:hypothetical protein EG68_00664 [Paragonimus skrjabini miyazakii]|uniref:G8 domain-containing protein n=1 Tax=Paragonimus skrjabini miyazakii TaxID=59628 RepID=A0A8S9Z2X0_9TREM|nr:hypothetical protein EG68_00664 [Paragonimus skrjabini miyazakii]
MPSFNLQIHEEERIDKNKARFRNPYWPDETWIKVERKIPASDKITGKSIILSFKGIPTTPIPLDPRAGTTIERILGIHPLIGHVKVRTHPGCSQFAHEIEFLSLGGNQPLLKVDVNQTVLEIYGSGFDAQNPQLNELLGRLNGVDVEYIAASDATEQRLTYVVKNLRLLPAGTLQFLLRVQTRGYARDTVSFNLGSADAQISLIKPERGDLSGGFVLSVYGERFDPHSATVTVGDHICPVIRASMTLIQCTVSESKTATSVAVIIHQNGITLISTIQFTYMDFMKPQLLSLQPSTGLLVQGGAEMEIRGKYLSNLTAVTIGDVRITHFLSHTPNSIVLITPPQSIPGRKSLFATHMSEDSTRSNLFVEYSFQVHNISAYYGSWNGGQILRIKGNNLANTTSVIMLVSDANCLGPREVACTILQSNDHYVECETGPVTREHAINDVGVHPDYGLGYKWKPEFLEIMQGDKITWRWSSSGRRKSIGVFEVNDFNDLSPNRSSFSFELTKTGSFSRIFTEPGYFYYASSDAVVMLGAIHVRSFTDCFAEVSVMSGDIEADYRHTHGRLIYEVGRSPVLSCNGYYNCDPLPSIPIWARRLQYVYRNCATPRVHSISPVKAASLMPITFCTDGLGRCFNQLVVKFDGAICETELSFDRNPSSVLCQLTHLNASQAKLTALQEIVPKITHTGMGNAFWTSRTDPSKTVFSFLPQLDNKCEVHAGSPLGGGLLTLCGSGFNAKSLKFNKVLLGSTTHCNIISVTAGQLSCRIPKLNVSSTLLNQRNAVPFKVLTKSLNEQWVPVTCVSETQCTYIFDSNEPPNITAIQPRLIRKGDQLVISGRNLFTNPEEIRSSVVQVGEVKCEIVNYTVDPQTITCQLREALPFGNHTLSYMHSPIGMAFVSEKLQVRSALNLESVEFSHRDDGNRIVMILKGNGLDAQQLEIRIGNIKCRPMNVHTASNYRQCVMRASNTKLRTMGPHENVTVTADDLHSSILMNWSRNTSDAVVYSSAGSGQTSFSYTTTPPSKSALEQKDPGQIPFNFEEEFFKLQVSYLRKTLSMEAEQSEHGDEGIQNDTNKFMVRYIHPTTVSDNGAICDVSVQLGSKTALLPKAYKYSVDESPMVHSIQPLTGGTSGGTRIVIHGRQLESPEGHRVSLGGVECPVEFANKSNIICETKPHWPPGRYQIAVYIVNGGRLYTSIYFTYVAAWSSNHTWGSEAIPRDGDAVEIPQNHTILLDQNTAQLTMLVINGGTLVFDPTGDVELSAKYIIIHNQGKLKIGSEEMPFMKKATITLLGHARDPELPVYGAKVLALRSGEIDIHGQPRLVIWTNLVHAAEVGTQTIFVEDSVDWKKGERIIITSTGFAGSDHENEVHVIEGETVLLDEHGGSDNDALDKQGGQIHIGGTEDPNESVQVRFDGVEFHKMGQARSIGRYPIYFHLVGNISGSHIKNCAMHKLFNRAITIHRTHELLVENNVIFDTLGSGIFLMDGVEESNTIQHNLLVQIGAITTFTVVDAFPASIHISNPFNTLIENVIAGGAYHGIRYKIPERPNGLSTMSATCPDRMFLERFQNNEVHSMERSGLLIEDGYFPTTDGQCQSTSWGKAVFDGLVVWHNGDGAVCDNCGGIQFRNFTLIGNRNIGIEGKLLENTIYYDPNNGPSYQDSVIISSFEETVTNRSTHYHTGVRLPCSPGLQIENLDFVNFNDHQTAAIEGRSGSDAGCHFCGGYEHVVRKLHWQNSSNRVAFRCPFDFTLRDEDGSLTTDLSGLASIPGSLVVPSANHLPLDSCGNENADQLAGLGSLLSPFSAISAVLCNPNVTALRLKIADSTHILKDLGSMTITLLGGGKSEVPKVPDAGWMTTMISNHRYVIDWSDLRNFYNLSYVGTLSNFREGDYVIIRHVGILHRPSRVRVFYAEQDRLLSTEPIDPVTSRNGEVFYNESEQFVEYIVKATPGRKRSTPFSLSVHFTGCSNTVRSMSVGRYALSPISEHVLYWSANETWGGLLGLEPVNGSTLRIPKNIRLIVDKSINLRLDLLEINGGLEFESGTANESRNYHIAFNQTLINKGYITAGLSPEQPLRHARLNLVMLGAKSNLDHFHHITGLAVGSKSFVYNESFGAHQVVTGAEVGVLESNIAIAGDQDSLHYRYGGHLLVIQTTTQNEANSTYLSGVLFERMGQYGPGIGRCALEFVGSDSPVIQAFVRESIFHNTFATAITVQEGANVHLSGNVIYNSIGSGSFLALLSLIQQI